jgi:prolipoprotein diacylglyceryltransferase
MSFHFLVGLTLLHLYRQGILRRRLFALYLVCYGVFRFSSEYLRVTEKVFTGLSAYQWFALLGVAAGLTAIALRSQSQTPPLANSRARA